MQPVRPVEPEPSAIVRDDASYARTRSRLRRQAWASFASLGLHLALVMALGAWMVGRIAETRSPRLEATLGLPQATTSPEWIAPATTMLPKTASSDGTHRRPVGPTTPLVAPPDSRSTANGGAASSLPFTPQSHAPQYADRGELTREVVASSNSPTSPEQKSGRRPTSAIDGVSMAKNAGEAVDRVLAGLRGELVGGDLLVVWLLDASLSVLDDRQTIAARLDPFYRELQKDKDSRHVLMSAAVAFGKDWKEIQPPTPYGVRLVTATADVGVVDYSGIENVMSAVEQTVAKYRRTWKGNMHIVVWTDESGDDVLRLEETIAVCRSRNVAVSVVGPTAVFGSERGFHPYADPATGYRFLLPVKRGPDTSLPERMPLPFWHEGSLPLWSQQGAQVDAGRPWYGGAYREGLLSGSGPYALTRLALQTGGRFLILDPEGDASPFDHAKLRDYSPDYGSADEYLRAVEVSPLRKAVVEAVQLAYREHERLITPKLSFVSVRDEFYPFEAHNIYLSPTAFRIDLKADFAEETSRVAAGLTVLEQALARFGPAGLEDEYERETLPRWQAWYDVTLGRLLAAHVRHVEYLQTCRMVFDNAAFLNSDTNHLTFVPSPQLRSTDPRVRARAAEAERLLRRCIERHPDTPFALLARWELEQPFGLAVRQTVIPQPAPVTATPQPRQPMPMLPRL